MNIQKMGNLSDHIEASFLSFYLSERMFQIGKLYTTIFNRFSERLHRKYDVVILRLRNGWLAKFANVPHILIFLSIICFFFLSCKSPTIYYLIIVTYGMAGRPMSANANSCDCTTAH